MGSALTEARQCSPRGRGHLNSTSIKNLVVNSEVPNTLTTSGGRFKLYLPGRIVRSGPQAISQLAQSSARSFLRILQAPDLAPFLPPVKGEDEA